MVGRPVPSEDVHAGHDDGDTTATLDRTRRSRLLPSAVTPIRPSDLLAAWWHRDGGRERFERAVAAFLDAHAVATYATYRRALFDCLRALRTAGDDRRVVVLPAFSSPDFEAAIEAAGLSVRYCDVEPETLAIDASSLEASLDDDALATFAVNLLGYGSRMDEVADRCASAGVHLIEVLGYSIGAEYDGRRLGTFGDGAVVNFQEGKPIPVGGGLVAWNRAGGDPEPGARRPTSPNYGAMLGYAVFGRPRPYALYHELSSALDRFGLPTDSFTTHSASKRSVDYEPPFEAMSDFQGALARRVLARLDSHRRSRARTARYYGDALSDCDGVDPVRPASGLGNVQYVRYPILVESPDLRSALRSALFDVGVQTSTLYSGLEIDADEFPGAERLRRSLLTLPTHPYVSGTDGERVVEVIEEVTALIR